MSKPDDLRWLTILGLGLGAVGISILWVSGVEFPVYPPPSAVILSIGALFLTLSSWRWSIAVGAFLGVFVLVGFVSTVVSGTGAELVSGE